MVDSNGFEPLRFLQFGFTVRRHQPLGQLSILLNTLLPMCILKHTRNPILRTLHGICFNMTNFFIYKKISHPRHRPFAPCLKCGARTTFPHIHTIPTLKTKNPRSVSPRVLEVSVQFNLHNVLQDPTIMLRCAIIP